MRTYRLWLFASVSLILVASAAAHAPVAPAAAPAAPSVVQETITGPEGSASTRTITAHDTFHDTFDAAPSSDIAPPALAGSRGANQYVWIDRNHGNAIAEHVAITGDGAYGVAGWWLNDMRVSLYRVPGGTGVPEWNHPMPSAEFRIPVDADFLGDRLTAVARREPLSVFVADSPDPIFTDSFTPPYVGYACSVSDDGRTFAGAGGDPSGMGGEVRVHDGTTGSLRFVRPLLSPPEGLCVSGDGRFVAATLHGLVKIWDATTGALRDSVLIPGETGTGAVLSRDGSYLVTGGYARTVRLYHWNGADYVQNWASSLSGTTSVTALAISRDATTIVAGTWTSPAGGRVVVYDRGSSTPIWTDSSFGDEVPSVAVTPNGRKIAAACWGRSGGTVGNVVSVYERASPAPLWTIGDDAIAGVGSCMSVDLSDNGRFLLAGGKSVHAREFGQGGFVLAIDVLSAAGIADPPAVAGAAAEGPFLTADPNPFCESVRVETGAAGARFSVWNANGRRIRSVSSRRWDGRDETGRDVPAGVYFLRGEEPRTPPVRVVRIR